MGSDGGWSRLSRISEAHSKADQLKGTILDGHPSHAGSSLDHGHDQEELVQDLLDTLKQCVERVDRYRRLGQRVGESNTKAGLIEPVIAALGWDVLDPDEVHREYRRRPADNPVDYALLLSRTPRLFIEAKGLGGNIDDPKWANQTISYAAVAGVEWVALTDGAEWRLYNAHAPVPVEQKLFRTVRLAEDIDAAFELLTLLSKDNLRDNRIQELWRGFFVDRQVNATLHELFNAGEPARDLVALVARRVPNLTKGDIRTSLIRARAAFDFPTPSLPTTPLPPAPMPDAPPSPRARPRGGATRQPRAGWTPVSGAERRVTLREVMASGRLQAGSRLEADYRGQHHTAELLADGQIRFAGETHGSLSSAGAAVKRAVLGPDIPESVYATDGWVFWRATDAQAGDTTTLRVIRQRVAATRSPDGAS
jgi:Restriction Enzyme Adenine Methylase Associated